MTTPADHPLERPWRPLSTEQVTLVLAVVEARWWLAGGVAIDLWLGRNTREHGDIDVSVVASDWPRIARSLPKSLDPYLAHQGRLKPLTDFTPPGGHNIWLLDRETGNWALQINLEEGDDASWFYRRNRNVARPWSEAIWRSDRIWVVDPAVQLLWKAASTHEKDIHDFELVLPLLGGADRDWLVAAIAIAHPQSVWLPRLTGS